MKRTLDDFFDLKKFKLNLLFRSEEEIRDFFYNLDGVKWNDRLIIKKKNNRYGINDVYVHAEKRYSRETSVLVELGNKQEGSTKIEIEFIQPPYRGCYFSFFRIGFHTNDLGVLWVKDLDAKSTWSISDMYESVRGRALSIFTGKFWL